MGKEGVEGREGMEEEKGEESSVGEEEKVWERRSGGRGGGEDVGEEKVLDRGEVVGEEK